MRRTKSTKSSSRATSSKAIPWISTPRPLGSGTTDGLAVTVVTSAPPCVTSSSVTVHANDFLREPVARPKALLCDVRVAPDQLSCLTDRGLGEFGEKRPRGLGDSQLTEPHPGGTQPHIPATT